MTMKTTNPNETVEVFAGTSWQADMVKSLLENADIGVFMKDELMGTIGPWYSSAGAGSAVKVIVAARDFEQARIVVEEYEKNLKAEL